jgi:hypothetical protein
MAIIKRIGEKFTLEQAIDMFCDDKTLKAAEIHPLNQGEQSGIGLTLTKQRGQFRYMPDIHCHLWERYIWAKEDIGEFFDEEAIMGNIKRRWTDPSSVTVEDLYHTMPSRYSIISDGTRISIHAMPSSILHGIGHGMTEIIGTMGISANCETEARYSRSPVEVVKKGIIYSVNVPIMAGVIAGIIIEDNVLQPLKEMSRRYK